MNCSSVVRTLCVRFSVSSVSDVCDAVAHLTRRAMLGFLSVRCSSSGRAGYLEAEAYGVSGFNCAHKILVGTEQRHS